MNVQHSRSDVLNDLKVFASDGKMGSKNALLGTRILDLEYQRKLL